MNERVQQLRVAVTWFETNQGLLTGTAPTTASLPYLGDDPSYLAAFESAVTGDGMLLPPWGIDDAGTVRARSNFWEHYLRKKHEDVRDVDALRLLMPFRLTAELRVNAPELGVTVRFERFLYPHGTAIVGWIVIDGKTLYPLTDAVNKIIEVRGRRLAAVAPDGTTVEMTFDKLAAILLARSREQRLGNAAASDIPPSEPFSVAAVIQGDGVDTGVATADDSLVHRGLNGLCTFDDIWEDVRPPTLAASSLKAKGSAASVLYQRRRGRALWFPERFASANLKRQRKLGCYMKNLLVLSMHVDALAGLVFWASKRLEAMGKKAIPPSLSNSVVEAANALARLYGTSAGPVLDTYRARSATAQINGCEALPAMNAIRSWHGDPIIAAVTTGLT